MEAFNVKNGTTFFWALYPSTPLGPSTRRLKDVGQPLYLTPYIKRGDIAGARKASRVTGLPNAPKLTSYSGYLTVNPNYNSNLFFWFFPALNGNRSAPLLLWLNGGPGSSSLFGMFSELGPYVINKDLTATARPYTWAQEFSLVSIDSPVGAGFSYTDSDAGYAREQADVARDLYSALQQFFTIFSDYRKNDFYLTGESYAGKYIPTLANKIMSEGKASNISMKGISIGAGWSDPRTLIAYGEYLFQIGLIDERQRDYFVSEQTKALNAIRLHRYVDAFETIDTLFIGKLFNGTTYFTNVTGSHYYYNSLFDTTPEGLYDYVDYLALPQTRLALHVGSKAYTDINPLVFMFLTNDFMQSVKPLLASILDNDYKVLLYSGTLDITVAPPLWETYVTSIQWKNAHKLKKANRIVWKVAESDTQVAGYVKHVDKFTMVVVRSAGHFLPHDQPRPAYDMISRFIRDIPFK